jgi:hypothetical protein
LVPGAAEVGVPLPDPDAPPLARLVPLLADAVEPAPVEGEIPGPLWLATLRA